MAEKKLNFVYLSDEKIQRELAVEFWKEEFPAFNFIPVANLRSALLELRKLRMERQHYALISDLEIGKNSIVNVLLQLERKYPEMHIIVLSNVKVLGEFSEKGIYVMQKTSEAIMDKMPEIFRKITNEPFRKEKEAVDFSDIINLLRRIKDPRIAGEVKAAIMARRMTRRQAEDIKLGYKYPAAYGIENLRNALNRPGFTRKEKHTIMKYLEAYEKRKTAGRRIQGSKSAVHKKPK